MADWQKFVRREEPENRACVVLVHGFHGDKEATWGEFSEHLKQQPALDGWDIVSFGYKSSLAPDLSGVWQGDPSITGIAGSLGTFARTDLSRFKVLAFIAHSMGGLVVQRTLLDHQAMAEKVDKVILFGTPSFGLKKSWLFQSPFLRWLNRQVSDMGKTSPFIKSLRQEWSERFGAGPPFEFLAVAGSEDEFVPRSASIAGFPDSQCAVVPGNHLQIVRPGPANDASVNLVSDFFRGGVQSCSQWNTAALSLEKREFEKVVQQLGPNQDSLDRRALVNLALALDGLGRRSEAMEILTAAERHDTDAMGVLAGRHKRNWIQERKDSEARAAVDLYSRAYEESAAKGDASQAFYHGINLAFLALVYEANIKKARDLARQVLAHCGEAAAEELGESRMWRLATEGEAHLILGDLGVAVDRYRQAIEGPIKPKPWQLISTSQQAYRIADQLNDEPTALALRELFG